ncbi:Alpha/Beta hydrolase protein [Globomyces pollinis-pini]|nr:Alpha/Beta hydrolase protein [Globomyces pollinis-pini]
MLKVYHGNNLLGPLMPSWSLKFHVLFHTIRYVLYKHNNFDSLLMAQDLTKLPNPNTSFKAIVKEDSCSRYQEAIDFIIQKSEHVPISCKDPNGTIKAEWVSCENSDKNTVVYMLHGGAYIFGSPQLERKMAYYIASTAKTQTFGIAYRLAPQYEFPCSLIDALSGYMYLLECGYLPENIVFSGSSAGGGLAMALLLLLRELDTLPMPAGAILISPWVDLTHSFPSFLLNKETDILPSRSRITFGDRMNAYAPNEILRLQYVSPVWAKSLSDLDLPILIQVGEVERLYDEDVALYQRLSKENLKCGTLLEVYQEQCHVFHSFNFLQSSKTAFQRIGQFFDQVVRDKVSIQSGRVDISPNGSIVKNESKLAKL